MYIALIIMCCGFILGKIFQNIFSYLFIHKAIMASIFLLLFLLGVSIGSNDYLISRLPNLGFDATILAIFGVAGSIGAQQLLKYIPAFKKFLTRISNER